MRLRIAAWVPILVLPFIMSADALLKLSDLMTAPDTSTGTVIKALFGIIALVVVWAVVLGSITRPVRTL